MTARELQRLAQELRITVLRMHHRAGSGHTGGNFSCAEILTVLYEAVLTVRANEPDWPLRDRFVLSKGHAAPALYATLARRGFFDSDLLMTLRRTGSPLQGHPCMKSLPGIDMSTGSLGMGLSVGVGMALAARLLEEDWRVCVLCGDGELNEGQNWEAMMSAAKWGLSNLTMIVDRNHVQLDGTEAEIMPMGDLAAKIENFGLKTLVCDGHDCGGLIDAFEMRKAVRGPAAIVAETVKGKGVSFMEGRAVWHGKPVGDEEFERALAELEGALR
ncbi:MAG: transketolase [Planctomycetota bacterium]